MNALPDHQASFWQQAVYLVIWAATLTPWVWVVRRLAAGKPVLRYQARRPVPWGLRELVLVLMFWLAINYAVVLLEPRVLRDWAESHFAQRFAVLALCADPGPAALSGAVFEGIAAPAALARGAAAARMAMRRLDLDRPPEDVSHPLLVVLRADRTWWTFGFCIFTAVLVAPLTEEILFRLLLQGWLEALERRLRRTVPALRRQVPGLAPVVIASLLFAGVHSRKAEPVDAASAFRQLAAGAAIMVLTAGFGLFLVRVGSRAGARDLGLAPRKLLGDVGIGLAAALATILPILTLQEWVQSYFMRQDWNIAADPIPLIPFAAALGILYCSTHRIVASITLHTALNLTSVAGAWFLSGG
ncbi:MAG: CPBP family glutamic-type intramembrane protease [Thermoguttaceae bacterium]